MKLRNYLTFLIVAIVALVGLGHNADSAFSPTPTGTGLRHVTSGKENAAASLVVNADVDPAASIAGTKITPNFGAQSVSTTGPFVYGATPATIGAVRFPTTTPMLAARNFANSGDLVSAATDASDNLFLGSQDSTTTNAHPQVFVNPASFGYLYAGGTQIALWSSGGLLLNGLITGNDPGGTGSIFGQISQALTSDFTTTTSTGAQNTNLTFGMLASDTWVVRFGGTAVAAANTSGVKFAVAIPTGAVIEGGMHAPAGTGLSTVLYARISAGSTLTAAFITVSAEAAPFFGQFRVKGNGVNSGSVTIQYAPGTTTAVTMKAGAWIEATRANGV